MKAWTFKSFMSQVDSLLKQGENQDNQTVDDSYRKFKQNEVRDVNLDILTEVNDSWYYQAMSYLPAEDGTSMNVPFFIKRLDRIYIDGDYHKVEFFGKQSSSIWWDGKRTITGNGISFSKDQRIVLLGIFHPEEVTDLNSIIDFPPSYMKLLLYKCLVDYADRDNLNKIGWQEKAALLERNYVGYTSPISVQGETINMKGLGT
jgi:hypothetical protein